MKKADRQKMFDKYGGRCAYCGCELTKGWNVDEIEPIVRGWRYIKDGNNNRQWCDVKNDWLKENYITHPERLNIENQNPSCGSCNRQKHSQSLEGFRQSIKQFVNSLNLYHNQYKFAKRYGLIQETGIEVKFYFETIQPFQQ